MQNNAKIPFYLIFTCYLGVCLYALQHFTHMVNGGFRSKLSLTETEMTIELLLLENDKVGHYLYAACCAFLYLQFYKIPDKYAIIFADGTNII